MKILNKIHTVFFAVEITLSILVVIAIMAIFPRHTRPVRRAWGRVQRFFMGYRLETIGKLDEEAQMIIMNHQSMLDIMIFEEIHPRDICWIAKKEIAELPIYGNILKIPRMLPIDRSNPRAMPKLVREAGERVNEGRPLMIFPEGTRGRGDKLLKFHSGAKIIADKLHLSVQPVVIVGSRDILDTKSFSLHRGTVKLIYLDRVDTSREDWLNETREKMQEILALNLKDK